MRHLVRALACFGALSYGPALGQEALGPPVASPYSLGEGLKASAKGIDARLRLRLHADLVESCLGALGQAAGANDGSASDVRRARALLDLRGAEGSALRPFRLRAQMDFRDLEVRWLDLYARYDGIFTGGGIVHSDVRLGEFREPFGLEAMTSVTYLPFIERSTATNTFTPGRSRGGQTSLRSAHWLLQAGAFRRTDGLPFPDEALDERAITARAVWQGDGRGLTQAGGSISLRNPRGDLLVFRGTTGSRLLERIADTGSIAADRAFVGGVEALLREGPWTAQSEAFGLWIDDANGVNGESFLSGGYLSVSRFLGAGETSWARGRGALGPPRIDGAIRPGGGGWQAMEAVARLSYTDLTGGSIGAGRILDLETGLNFHLSPTTRLMLHWISVSAAPAGGSSEEGWAALARLQVQI
ncbi:MAG: OprO/OprP family phosphate-selective porin [Planctomycetota bacterium]